MPNNVEIIDFITVCNTIIYLSTYISLRQHFVQVFAEPVCFEELFLNFLVVLNPSSQMELPT